MDELRRVHPAPRALALHAMHPAFRKIEVYSPRSYTPFACPHPNDVDQALFALFSEAYRVGEQRHPNG